MEDYDTKVAEKTSDKDSYFSKQVQNIDNFNKPSIADQDPEFFEELNQVISDSSIPDGKYDDTNSNVGKICEAPTTVHGIHYQEGVPSDAYVKIELGFPQGSHNTLMHAMVKEGILTMMVNQLLQNKAIH